ncbi:MAG: winged helix-turn-helix transcriptional regulator, partial [Candidatus Micrarchaeota archaeon]|nr:winged helix-turn-helix transcriptional regulator [Candidatus Micrarchaeota archaeon]
MATSCPARSLDLRDRRILYELDVDARATLLRIAKRVGLSKDAVKYRIGNLVSSGAAKGFIAVIDTARLGYITFGVFLKFR